MWTYQVGPTSQVALQKDSPVENHSLEINTPDELGLLLAQEVHQSLNEIHRSLIVMRS